MLLANTCLARELLSAPRLLALASEHQAKQTLLIRDINPPHPQTGSSSGFKDAFPLSFVTEKWR